MKNRKSICFCILALVMLISVNNILAETAGTGTIEFTVENAVNTVPKAQLFCYDVTCRNFHKAYKPEMFNTSGVKSKEYQKVDGRETDDWYRFEFQDGHELYIPSGLSLMYGDARMEYYSQVLTYLQCDLDTMECKEIEGFSLDEARKKADALIAVLDIANLEPDLAVSLSHEDLGRITKEMRETFAGEPKVKYFDSFTRDIDAYYLTYRQVLNGIKTAGMPQVAVVVTRDGIASLELSCVIDRVNETTPLTKTLSREEATELCSGKYRNEFKSLPENMRITNEIAEISVAHFFEFDEDGTDEYHAGVFPCWFFKGEQMRFADEAEIGVSPIRDLYRIPDGHWFYGD